MRIVSKSDVLNSISMKEAIEVMEEGFCQFHEKKVLQPLRTILNTSNGPTLFMPSSVEKTSSLGLKVVSVRGENPKKNLPSVPGAIIIVNEETGVIDGVVDASELTAIRTAAGSSVATKYLAKENTNKIVCFGSGAQAKWHIKGMISIRPMVQKVVIYSRKIENAKSLCETLSKEYSNVEFTSTDDGNKEIPDADIIITATNTSIPLFDGKLLPKGVHLNCVGSYTPKMQEVDEITIQRSKICVDDLESVLEEAGDIIIPLEKKLIDQSQIKSDLGKLSSEKKSFRDSDFDITLFKSVGM
eukprot:gene1520-12646_t